MTTEEKIAWLARYQQAVTEERRLEKAIKAAKRRELAAREVLPKKSKGLQLLQEYQQELDAKIQQCEQIRQEVEQAIAELPNATHRTVLLARYVDGMDWWQVANIAYISERWARAIHRTALSKLRVPLSSAKRE